MRITFKLNRLILTIVKYFWQLVLKDIQYLEKIGITVRNNLNIKGTIANLVFDNLGANMALGFSGCSSTNYCRVCELDKCDCQAASR